MSEKTEYYLDIAEAIEYHNLNNPGNPITRRELAEKTNRSYQALVNYQNGRRVPDIINFIQDVQRITGYKKSKLIKIKKV